MHFRECEFGASPSLLTLLVNTGGSFSAQRQTELSEIAATSSLPSPNKPDLVYTCNSRHHKLRRVMWYILGIRTINLG